VKELLDVKNCPTRPVYEMADDQPLVLWDCKFSATHGKVKIGEERHWDRGSGADELEWLYPNDVDAVGNWKRTGLMEDLWASWRSAKLDEVLWSQLLDLSAKRSPRADSAAIRERQTSTRVFSGDNNPAPKGKYVPVMNRDRMEHFEIVNARWADRRSLETCPATDRDTPR
jgi:tRNA pseudouridine38/39 synthase